jgi:predicted N-formylglutamate amidohydrolase
MSEEIVDHIRNNSQAPVFFVCEHASSFIPECFNELGLVDPARSSHIAWDPGAEAVTRILADRFNAPAVISRISRLVYDCNRPPDAIDAVPQKSEIFEVPGNKNLSDAQITNRVENYYLPFKRTLEKAIEEHQVAPMLVTIHSFTPVYNGQKRDVEIGLLHDDDSLVVDAMLNSIVGYQEFNIRRNEPYGPSDGVTHTIRLHGVEKGLLNVMIEVRNDLLTCHKDCTSIADTLESLISAALGQLAKDKTTEAVVL